MRGAEGLGSTYQSPPTQTDVPANVAVGLRSLGTPEGAGELGVGAGQSPGRGALSRSPQRGPQATSGQVRALSRVRERGEGPPPTHPPRNLGPGVEAWGWDGRQALGGLARGRPGPPQGRLRGLRCDLRGGMVGGMRGDRIPCPVLSPGLSQPKERNWGSVSTPVCQVITTEPPAKWLSSPTPVLLESKDRFGGAQTHGQGHPASRWWSQTEPGWSDPHLHPPRHCLTVWVQKESPLVNPSCPTPRCLPGDRKTESTRNGCVSDLAA